MAFEWGNLSHCERKKVGAIIVKNKMIISDGFNGAPSGFDNNCEDENGDTNWYVLKTNPLNDLLVHTTTTVTK